MGSPCLVVFGEAHGRLRKHLEVGAAERQIRRGGQRVEARCLEALHVVFEAHLSVVGDLVKDVSDELTGQQHIVLGHRRLLSCGDYVLIGGYTGFKVGRVQGIVGVASRLGEHLGREIQRAMDAQRMAKEIEVSLLGDAGLVAAGDVVGGIVGAHPLVVVVVGQEVGPGAQHHVVHRAISHRRLDPVVPKSLGVGYGDGHRLTVVGVHIAQRVAHGGHHVTHVEVGQEVSPQVAVLMADAQLRGLAGVEDLLGQTGMYVPRRHWGSFFDRRCTHKRVAENRLPQTAGAWARLQLPCELLTFKPPTGSACIIFALWDETKALLGAQVPGVRHDQRSLMIFAPLDLYGLDPVTSARLDRALDWLRTVDPSTLELGRNDIDGDDIFANVLRFETSPAGSKSYEAHRLYLDVHYVFEGTEVIGITPTKDCLPQGDYNQEDDYCMYDDGSQESWVTLKPGDFCVTPPYDAHKPGCCAEKPEPLYKAVVKVKIG